MQKGNVHSLHPTVYLESVLKEHAKACEGEYSSNIPHIFFLFLFPSFSFPLLFLGGRKYRWEMKELMTSGRLSCAILWKEQMNLENKHTIAYDDYVAIMADSIFLPCPAGNNPETFRHYEALELGAIPLIVVGKADGETWTGKKEVQDRQNGRGENETKVRRGDINFLEYWEGYPGPLLESWEEAQSVMTALVSTPAVLDKLQRRLQNWYKSFKGLTRQRMALIIQGRMDINAQSERKTRRFEQTVIEV